MKQLIVSVAFAMALFTSCKEKAEEANTEEVAVATTEATQPEDSEWEVLFDGTNIDKWHAYNGGDPTQWEIVDDVLVFTPAENRNGSENLVTNEAYTSFVLKMDWMISEGGNSGIMWAVEEDPKYHEPYATGPEIQILDDERHPDTNAGPSHRSGALYDMIGAPEGVVNPAGEWNSYEITIDYNTNQGIIVLNGEEVVTFAVKGEAWEDLVSNSKFASWEAFAKADTGLIALQDHGHQVSFKNIKIKKL